MTTQYFNPTDDAAKQLFSKSIQGELVMLNLLRFKDAADCSNAMDIAPQKPISGKDAYQIYVELTLPLLRKSGGDIIYLGKCDHFFIGPSEEKWDLIMLIKQQSIADFLAFATDPHYQKIIGHREAAIIDSWFLPSEKLPILI
ncbi:MAG: hypothetical protein ACI97K_000864 [Glaciecola sp.]|jgi:uncharacterized protein (DUF1330 family)